MKYYQTPVTWTVILHNLATKITISSFFSRRRWPNVHVTIFDFKLQTTFLLPEKMLSRSSDFGSIIKFIYTVHMQLSELSHF